MIIKRTIVDDMVRPIEHDRQFVNSVCHPGIETPLAPEFEEEVPGEVFSHPPLLRLRLRGGEGVSDPSAPEPLPMSLLYRLVHFVYETF